MSNERDDRELHQRANLYAANAVAAARAMAPTAPPELVEIMAASLARAFVTGWCAHMEHAARATSGVVVRRGRGRA